MDTLKNTDSSLNLSDLKNMMVFIDLAVQRGALRAAELSSVAMLYDRINQLVQDIERKIKTEGDKVQ